MTSDKRWQAKFSGIVLRWKQFLSFKNCRSVSICSVQNRSNRDTTVYYRLIFCAFSWPNMVKWPNSGIINVSICHFAMVQRTKAVCNVQGQSSYSSYMWWPLVFYDLFSASGHRKQGHDHLSRDGNCQINTNDHHAVHICFDFEGNYFQSLKGLIGFKLCSSWRLRY